MDTQVRGSPLSPSVCAPNGPGELHVPLHALLQTQPGRDTAGLGHFWAPWVKGSCHLHTAQAGRSTCKQHFPEAMCIREGECGSQGHLSRVSQVGRPAQPALQDSGLQHQAGLDARPICTCCFQPELCVIGMSTPRPCSSITAVLQAVPLRAVANSSSVQGGWAGCAGGMEAGLTCGGAGPVASWD